MSELFARVRRQPGIALLVLALLLAAALYAPTLGRGLVNYEDPWLYASNFVVQDASLASLRTIFFDLDVQSPARFALAPEYLPVRDLSVMLDFAIWGDWYGGFHLTNLVLYLAGIALVFAWLDAFGVSRTTAGLAALFWATHASHAESVAWLSERKGLLGVVFAAAAGLGYARFRAGRSGGWLAMAAVAAVAAVWSKAPAAFLVASLAGLEIVLPARRVSLRRSLVGLGTIAVCGALAFVPVVQMARDAAVVGDASAIPGGRAVAVLGALGFYVQLGAMAIGNAVSYPIGDAGPTALQLVLGGAALVGLVVALRPRVQLELRAGAVLIVFGWLPFSHLLLPLQMVAVADRYALQLTIGLAVLLAVGVQQLANRRLAIALATTITLVGIGRTLVAQQAWSSDLALWERAVESNPADGEAWSSYIEALRESGQPERAMAALEAGLSHSQSPRLLMRKALVILQSGRRDEGVAAMRQAAAAGEPRAMSNLALLLLEERKPDEALGWARQGAQQMPQYAQGHRTHGKVALESGQPAEALAAFERAYALEPKHLGNRFNLALALRQLGRHAEARPHLEACLDDPRLGAQARALLR